ncbi:MAG: hypothetical protein HY455_01765 [Parcubacteria group bacterium]|nr:hypothetical protein [Parcubacteria group bacterium]
MAKRKDVAKDESRVVVSTSYFLCASDHKALRGFAFWEEKPGYEVARSFIQKGLKNAKRRRDSVARLISAQRSAERNPQGTLNSERVRSVLISREEYEQLRDEAHETHVTISELVRAYVIQGLEEAPKARKAFERRLKKQRKAEVAKSHDKFVRRIVRAATKEFPSFGGGQTSDTNPIARAMSDKPPKFAAMVDIESVVRFVFKRAATQLEREKQGVRVRKVSSKAVSLQEKKSAGA